MCQFERARLKNHDWWALVLAEAENELHKLLQPEYIRRRRGASLQNTFLCAVKREDHSSRILNRSYKIHI